MSLLRELWSAVQVPVFATCALLTIYFTVINNYDYAQIIIRVYFMACAWYTVHYYQSECLRNSLGGIYELSVPHSWALGMNWLEIASLLFSLYAVYLYTTGSNWMVNNYFAFNFSVYSIEKWSLNKFWQIVIAFACLIAYDVVFVYHSDVMMTVATSFESPMKLLINIKGKG